MLLGPRQVRVLSVGELFREPDLDQRPAGISPELHFQGEEKITGALVSMTLEHPPLVVFVNDGLVESIGARGLFEHVAQRLRNMNFQVEQWSPAGRAGPMGQPMPAGPPPEPKPGQPAVWVVLADTGYKPAQPMGVAGYAQIIERIKGRLAAGDGAMIMLSASGTTPFGGGGAVVQLLEPWGISPQLDRLVLRQITLPDHTSRPVSRHEIVRWPKGSPITGPLAGMPGVFLQASPLVLGDAAAKGVELWPLAEVGGDEVWAERDFRADPPPSLDPAGAGGPFVIAAAARRGTTGRLVVVGDPVWAADEITTNADRFLRAAGMAELFGAAFPANAELFVNSVQWLAGLDQLIAASARTQDIRRVGPVPNLTGLKWSVLAGAPGAVAIAGLAVWLVRRRG